MVSDAQKKAIKKYQAANYEFIKIRLNKGEKDIITEKAKSEGISVNALIRRAVL